MSEQKKIATTLKSTTRRMFIGESTVLLLSSLTPWLLTSCGSSGGSTTTPSPTPTPTPSPTPSPTPGLSLVSISTTTPTALSPITVKLAGFNPTQAFTVSFSGSSGNQAAQTAIRAEADGTVVIPTPLHFDAGTGNTSNLATTLAITQNNATVSVPIVINDIPQLGDFGVSLGAITRAFYVHQELALAASINAQQAIAALPSSTVNNATLIADLQAQLIKVILARNDIDRIIANNTVQIAIGTAPDGTPISFNARSVETMDRIIAQYLLAYSANGTLIGPSRFAARQGMKPQNAASGQFQVPPAVMAAILQSIQTLNGAVSFKGTQQTVTDPKSSTLDSVLSVLSTAATVVTVSASLIAIGAAVVVDAPVIAVGAGAVATYASLAGVLVSSASMGNDLYNVATNAYTAVTAVGGSAAQTSAKTAAEQALASLANDTVTTFLNAEGVGGLNNPSIIGPAASSVFEGIFAPAASDIGLAAAGLLTSVTNLLIPGVFSNDGAEASTGLNSLGANTSFGQVDGTVTVSNTQGVLSGLTGVGAGNSGIGTNEFTTMAAPDGSYNLVIPLGNSAISYSSMTVSAFDPISDLSLASTTVDLSTINPNTPIKGPSLSGVCNDTDAGAPDADDPDCD